MTQAAWGRQKMIHRRPLFCMNNYECGLVLLPKNFVDYFNGVLKKNDWDESMMEDDFIQPVDLPFEVPCIPFEKDEEVFYYDVYEMTI